MAKFFNPLH